MAAKIGQALYWLGTGIASLLVIFGVFGLVQSDPTFTVVIFGPAILIYWTGRALQYVLSKRKHHCGYKPLSDMHEMGNETQASTPEAITIHSPEELKKLLLILSLFMAAIPIVLIISDPSLKGDLYKTSMIWIGALAMCSLSILFVINIIRDAPKIVLDSNGISIFYTFHSKSWRWSELGPIYPDSALVFMKYVCACSASLSSSVPPQNQPKLSTLTKSDLVIPLWGFAPGWNMRRATEFAHDLNAWREKYGRSQNVD